MKYLRFKVHYVAFYEMSLKHSKEFEASISIGVLMTQFSMRYAIPVRGINDKVM